MTVANVMPVGLRGKVAVVGVGRTAYGRFPGFSSEDLGIWALDNALADAGLSRSDVDGLIVSRIPDYQLFCEMTNINPRFANVTPGQGWMSGATIELAVLAVASGMCNVVALVYGNNGGSAGARYGGAGDRYGGAGRNLAEPYGMTSPGAVHAMMFGRHQHLYGTTSDQLAQVAISFRDHAALNPDAVKRDRITIGDYHASRYICEPLHIYDYCLINDGGVAIILAASDRAKDFPKRPVYIRGFGQASRLADSSIPPDDFWYAPMHAVVCGIYKMAGISREDLSALMIYDNFSPTVLFSLEGFGFCHRGESGAYVAQGNLRLGGPLPTNPSGGQLSESYMQGWSLNVEAVRQLRGECGDRQIKGAAAIQYICASPIVTSIVYGNDA